MKNRLRIASVLLTLLFLVGAVQAGCPPVVFGHTTVYYQLLTCHGEGCVAVEDVVGECTLNCDGTTTCWGNNNCGGLTRCRTQDYVYCGDCTPDY